MKDMKRHIITVIFTLVLLFCPHVLVFIFPGALIIFSKKSLLNKSSDWLRILSVTLITSLGFWVISYWLTMLIPINLTTLFHGANIVFFCIFEWLLYRRKPGISLDFDSRDLLLLGILILTAFVRFIPLFDHITGSVGDMTQHNYMTKIIIDNNGFTDSYAPIMPFTGFGEYPLGFHTISAIISIVGGYPFYRVTNFVGCVAAVLVTLAFYLLLSRQFARLHSFVTACLVSFLSHYPQFLMQWGSATTLLSVAFYIFAFTMLTEIDSEHCPTVWETCSIAVVLAAGFLTHIVTTVGFAVYYLLAELLHLRQQGAMRSLLRYKIPIMVLSIVSVIPFLINFDFAVFSESVSTLVTGHEASVLRVLDLFNKGNLSKVLVLIEPWIVFVFVFGPAFTIILFFMAALGIRRYIRTENKTLKTQNFLVQFFGAVSLFVLLYYIFRFHIGPFYHLFQAERVHYFLLIPGAIIIAYALNDRVPGRNAVLVAIPVLSIALGWHYIDAKSNGFQSHYTTFKSDKNIVRFLMRETFFGSAFSYAFDKVNSAVTDSDIKAMEWIRDNTGEHAIFLTNYVLTPELRSVNSRLFFCLNNVFSDRFPAP